jgi:Sigma-70 region 2
MPVSSASPARLHPLPAPGSAPAFRPDPELVMIVAAAQAGDDAAWTALVRRLEPPLRRVARGYRLTPAQVEDVLQTTWTRAFVGIQRLREPGSRRSRATSPSTSAPTPSSASTRIPASRSTS